MQPLTSASPTENTSTLMDGNAPEQRAVVNLPNYVPSCTINHDLWTSLRKRSVAVAERKSDGHIVSLLDIKQLLCSPETRHLAAHPGLFDVMENYYKDALARTSLRTDQVPEAKKVLEQMQDMRLYPPLCAKLGKKISSLLAETGADMGFLDQSVPVIARDHPTFFRKSSDLLHRLKSILKTPASN